MRSVPVRTTSVIAFLLCLFTALPWLARTAHAQVAEQDRAALIALYEATTVNEPWYQEYGFSQAVDNDDTNDVPVSEWRTSEPLEIVNGRVVYVDLFANNLNGTLPDELCDLDQLRALDLGANKLEGTIPACIGAMTALTELDIAGQDMSGTLPESLLDLENLEILDLAHNDLTGSIPSSLGDALSRLVELKLGPNQFAGSIPPSLGNLTDLRVLDLDGNALTGTIPPSLGDLTNLESLVLRENQLSGAIPASLSNLASLTRLDLSSNRLTGTIPATLGGLSNLQYLLLMANDLTDFEPGSYAGWANLRAFYVGGNELSELPDLSAASGITEIQVSSNLLSFADLEPLVALNPSDFFSYDPQRTLLEVRQTVEDDIVVLSVEEDGSATTYQWERWDPGASAYVEVEGATDRSYSPAEHGSYQCRLTNPLLPELTLRSYPVRLEGTVIVVNSAGDAEDDSTDDDACDTGETVTGSDGQEVPECTLRAALETVNASGSDVPPRIAFDIPGQGVPTIEISEAFPRIETPVTIDGTTQAGGNVVILGPNNANGIDIRSGGSGSTIKGLILAGFNVGIVVGGASDNTLDGNEVVGNRFGIAMGGDSDLGTSARNVVQNNVLGDNARAGIFLGDEDTESTIANNFIGTERDGMSLLPNGIGIHLRGELRQTMIRNNVISGNQEWGIVNVGAEIGHPVGLVIEGNKVGTDLTASKALPNGADGIRLFRVSGAEVYNNVVVGNRDAGLFLEGLSDSVIEGNYIGTNENAATGLGNEEHGIDVLRGRKLRIDGNVVAGNGYDGIDIDFATDVEVRRNGIGVFVPPDASLDAVVPLGNARCGVSAGFTTNLRIEENIIAGNGADGVCASNGKGTMVISENLIGVEETVAGPIGNEGHGISLAEVPEGEIIQNVVVFNGRDGMSLRDSEDVIVLFNVITDNNQAGVRAEAVSELILEANEVLRNQGSGTGIHLTASSATIEGNQITDDVGDAITLEDGSTATVTGNNIFGNGGMGLSNLTPSVVVPATGNWWGDASGPGGEGPGSGNAVSAGVDYADWRDAMVDVVVSASHDEVVLPAGETDTVSVFLQNWAGRDDVMDVTVSDTEGWLQSPGSQAVALDDTTGADVQHAVSVPAGAGGSVSTVTVEAVSRGNPDHTATATFTLSAERAALAEVVVAPGAVEVAPGDTVRFDAVGLDQFSRTVALTPSWSATGGAIDEDGVYVAGAASGTFVVTATDPATGLSGTARVGNGVPVHAEDAEDVPGAVQLAQNYPNPFRSETTIAFTLPQATHVRLAVYDVLGREVAVLVDAMMSAGRHTARLAAGPLASGFYLCRLEAGGGVAARPMVLLR